MRCKEVEERLTSFLAGECTPREKCFIKRHLHICSSCTAEKASLETVGKMLDTWGEEEPPGELPNEIMSAVKKGYGSRRRLPRERSVSGLMRDLAVAAAVTLALFWTAGNWLSPAGFDTVGKNVNGAARTYTRATVVAVEKAVTLAGDYTGEITVKEWDWE